MLTAQISLREAERRLIQRQKNLRLRAQETARLISQRNALDKLIAKNQSALNKEEKSIQAESSAISREHTRRVKKLLVDDKRKSTKN